MADMPAYDRSAILRRTAQLMSERIDELGRTISLEEGKTLPEGCGEVGRSVATLELSAEEAKRLDGEVLPLDAAPGHAGQLGFTLRVPVGVVAAISPFNFPLNLVCHKVGPALAAGNSVVLKPASDTPLVALKLTEILLEAGLPPSALSCITGSGGLLGDAITSDRRVRKITFTGSREVGEHIVKTAGLKKVTMELGSNCPVIVADDADLELAVEQVAFSGFANAGQVCISAQRILVMDAVHDEFLERLAARVGEITAGDQLDEGTNMGPMIRESDAIRVKQWVDEALDGSARLICGGQRDGCVMQPTVAAGVEPSMRISREEVFGPVVGVTRVGSFEEAIRLANDSCYGLGAAVFTRDLNRAMQFARQVEAGNLQVNWGTAWRADLMPYGGLKESGLGKEGPKYTINEMTETKMVVLHGLT